MSDIREAAFSNDIERLKYFVEVVGIDVNEPNAVNGWTGAFCDDSIYVPYSCLALHWACRGDNLESAQYLIAKGVVHFSPLLHFLRRYSFHANVFSVLSSHA
jgi:hypothetical protein